jgi:hypothetical protein
LALLVASSPADLDEAYSLLVTSVRDEPEAATGSMGVLPLLERWAQIPRDAIDPTRPFAVALQWAAMGAGPPTWTFVVPLRDPERFAESSAPERGGASVRVVEGYAQVSTPSPADPPPITELPPLARDLGDAELVARLDLEGLGETALPLLRMLSSARAAGSPADSIPSSGKGPTQWLPPLLPLFEELFDSFTRLELELDVDVERIDMQVTKRLHPGSALAPGPQPDLDLAMELAQLLPEGPGLRQVSALDLSGVGEFLLELQRVMASMLVSDDADDPAMAMQRELWSRAQELWPLEWQPAATWLGWEEGGSAGAWIAQVEDPQVWIEKISELLRLIEASGGGIISLEQAEWSAQGRPGITWSWQVEASPDDSSPATERTVAQRSLHWLFEDLLPPIHVFAHEDLLVVRLSRERAAMEALIDRVERGERATEPALSRARQWAGPSAQLVGTVQTHALLATLFSALGQTPQTADESPSDPIEIRYALTVEPEAYGFRLQSSLRSVQAIARAVRQVGATFGAEATMGGDEEVGRPEMTAAIAESLAAAVGARVEEIRGREFLEPVPVRIVDDATARAYFISRIERFVEPERLRAQQIAYEQLGLLPAGYDLYDELLELLREQAGGYYDPGEGTMFLLDDMPPAMSSVILAHELTHALDDQHFDLDRLLESVVDDDDRSNALGAVLEGSGTLIMAVFSMQEMMAGRLGLEAMQSLQESEMGRAEVLESAPAVVQRSLLAPYVLGQRFLGRGDAMAMLQGANAEDIDRAFREPPASTEQVLHPEKYWDPDERDLPRDLEIPDLSAELGEGWSLVGTGRLGELDLGGLVGVELPDVSDPASMMGDGWANPAAAGWGADQWVVLRKGAQHLTVLATLWDSESDAAEFVAALQLPPETVVESRADAVIVVGGDLPERHANLAGRVLDEIMVK